MSYDAWKLQSPDDRLEPCCGSCGGPADCLDEHGCWRCVDCMFDEACEPDHDTRARQAIEKTETDDENV